ncbi:hypothetical protein [Streptomyces sp. uw30]|uniref:hypothetical protein n=1 Tax=Streptomyces sp. uw30 TaxID=1828179 RepID=UPI002905ADF5|nr:hypothetical protein [Streptomyces sp. uw30]
MASPWYSTPGRILPANGAEPDAGRGVVVADGADFEAVVAEAVLDGFGVAFSGFGFGFGVGVGPGVEGEGCDRLSVTGVAADPTASLSPSGRRAMSRDTATATAATRAAETRAVRRFPGDRR